MVHIQGMILQCFLASKAQLSNTTECSYGTMKYRGMLYRCYTILRSNKVMLYCAMECLQGTIQLRTHAMALQRYRPLCNGLQPDPSLLMSTMQVFNPFHPLKLHCQHQHPTSANCKFSFWFPAVFGDFWVLRNLETRNLETLKELQENIQKITSSRLKSLIFYLVNWSVSTPSNHSSQYSIKKHYYQL